MTPARLHALLDVDEYVHAEADRRARRKAGRPGGDEPRPAPSKNPAADLAALARMQ